MKVPKSKTVYIGKKKYPAGSDLPEDLAKRIKLTEEEPKTKSDGFTSDILPLIKK